MAHTATGQNFGEIQALRTRRGQMLGQIVLRNNAGRDLLDLKDSLMEVDCSLFRLEKLHRKPPDYAGPL